VVSVFRQLRKKRAIKSYLKKLPALLSKDYGKSKKYTPKQVVSTAGRNGLNTLHICYGLAMFCEEGLFDDYHRSIGSHCGYKELRGGKSQISTLVETRILEFLQFRPGLALVETAVLILVHKETVELAVTSESS